MPTDLFAQAGINPNSQPVDLLAQSGINPNPPSGLANFAGGAINALQQPAIGINHLVGHLINSAPLKNAQAASPFNYDPNSLGALGGSIAGNLGTLGAGGALGGLIKSAGVLPHIEEAGEILGQAPKFLKPLGTKLFNQIPQMLGQGTMGALSAPNSPILGGALGAVAAASSPLLSKLVDKVNETTPVEYAKHILGTLLSGTKGGTLDSIAPVPKVVSGNDIPSGIEGNTENIANILSDNYAKLKGISKVAFDNVFNRANQIGLGNNLDAGNFSKVFKENDTGDIAKGNPPLLKGLPGKIQDYIRDFVNTPPGTQSLNTAKDIQSKLFNLANKTNDADQAGLLKNIRETLLDDIQNHLKSSGLDVPYQQARTFYRINQVPYSENRKIFDAITGSGNMNNPSEIFKNPDANINTAQGYPNVTLRTVLAHGGDELKNRILADSLRSQYGKLDPISLNNAAKQLPAKGFGTSMTPQIRDMFNILDQKLTGNPLAATFTKLATAHLGGIGSLINTVGREVFPSLGRPILNAIGSNTGRQLGRLGAAGALSQIQGMQ